MRNVTDEGRLVLGAPSRVAFDAARNRLYVADSSNNQIVGIDVPKASTRPRLLPRAPLPTRPAAQK
jgi:DNA-binding beta-propeller fold protein YncE